MVKAWKIEVSTRLAIASACCFVYKTDLRRSKSTLQALQYLHIFTIWIWASQHTCAEATLWIPYVLVRSGSLLFQNVHLTDDRIVQGGSREINHASTAWTPENRAADQKSAVNRCFGSKTQHPLKHLARYGKILAMRSNVFRIWGIEMA